MTFNDDARLDTSQVSGGSGGGFGGGMRPGGMVVGGGGGLIVVVLLFLLQSCLGGGGGGTSAPPIPDTQANNPFDTTQVAGGGRNANTELFANCKTGADANRDPNCRVVGTVNSVQDFWTNEMKSYGETYRPTKTVLYSGTTQSRCGTASNQVGPFYCPLDRQVYIDASFFDQLSKFGASSGSLAQMYVVAHEYGHALQDQLGVLEAAQRDPKGPESGGVRVELMADCLAGMWVKNASSTKDAGGRALIKPVTEKQIKDALSAASAVGDDSIQKKTQGRVSPENFTHGTSQQRMSWFMKGYEASNINSCNTLRTSNLG